MDDLESKAKKLAENARGNIKSSRLVRTSSGIIGSVRFGAYLYSDPIITYFQENEQPHYFHYNESKGVKIGSIKEKSGWSGDYRNGMWVTNEGVHFTVGRQPDDFHHFIPFKSIISFEAASGIMKNKFNFNTDKGEVRFPTDPSTDIEDTQRYIRKKVSNATSSSSLSQSTVNEKKSEAENKNNSEDLRQSANQESKQKGDSAAVDRINTGSTTNDDISPIKLLSNADEYVITAEDLRDEGKIKESVNKYSKAIELYEEAIEEVNEKETIDRISSSLEKTRKKYKESNILFESISSLREQLHSAERSFKEAVAAFISGNETVSNIRFRQARDQFEEALEQSEMSESDLFETAITVSSKIAIESPQQDLTDYSHISDETLSILDEKGMENLEDIDSNLNGEGAAVISKNLDLNLESGNTAEVEAALISCWYSNESFKFNSTDDISMRQKQSTIGFKIT